MCPPLGLDNGGVNYPPSLPRRGSEKPRVKLKEGRAGSVVTGHQDPVEFHELETTLNNPSVRSVFPCPNRATGQGFLSVSWGHYNLFVRSVFLLQIRVLLPCSATLLSSLFFL